MSIWNNELVAVAKGGKIEALKDDAPFCLHQQQQSGVPAPIKILMNRPVDNLDVAIDVNREQVPLVRRHGSKRVNATPAQTSSSQQSICRQCKQTDPHVWNDPTLLHMTQLQLKAAWVCIN